MVDALIIRYIIVNTNEQLQRL